MNDEIQHVFLIGAKSIGRYGGYETFINKLTEYHESNKRIKYHIACKANGTGSMDETKLEGVTRAGDSEFVYHNARCFKIQVPNIGSVQAVYYDIKALNDCCIYIRDHKISHPIVYIMACRIGLFMVHYRNVIHNLGGNVFLNPDGHEWMRGKWGVIVQKYWKSSEKIMVKYCDLVICDSVNIESYIHDRYDGKGMKGGNCKTIYIAYGAETRESELEDHDLTYIEWLNRNGLEPNEYYLVVGRFVPENNFETIIREFMKSKSKRNLIIIATQNGGYLKKLEESLHFSSDKRIKFVGTVYDQELLMKIRENTYAYFHGHEVGGTNPSLLEALGSTKLNLLFDVEFNKEVGKDAALYWNKEEGSLEDLIDKVEKLRVEEIIVMGEMAKKRISQAYSWELISSKYEKVFLGGTL